MIAQLRADFERLSSSRDEFVKEIEALKVERSKLQDEVQQQCAATDEAHATCEELQAALEASARQTLSMQAVIERFEAQEREWRSMLLTSGQSERQLTEVQQSLTMAKDAESQLAKKVCCVAVSSSLTLVYLSR